MSEKDLNRGFRVFELPEKFNENLWEVFGLKPSQATLKTLAIDILKMSDFYKAHPTSQTPWNEEWCQRAQAFYFLPLNFIRNQAVFREGARWGFFQGLQSAVDVGSGLGAVRFASADLPLQWQGCEISLKAQELSSKLLSKEKLKFPFVSKIDRTDLVTFSFSLTENFDLTDIQNLTENLMILEPALRPDSRRLQGLRQELIDKGWNIWAPCTHQENCPLLKNESDWCHDRIHFKAPDWFREMENYLPMKNTNLAHAYLLASKRPAPRTQDSARTVGDFLREKGKSKILICRNSEKENLTWLHRRLDPAEISRGALVRLPQEQIKKSQEVRLSADILFPDVKILP